MKSVRPIISKNVLLVLIALCLATLLRHWTPYEPIDNKSTASFPLEKWPQAMIRVFQSVL